MRDILFNGSSLNSKGFAVSTYPTYRIAEPEIEFVAIPARDGEAAISNKRYKNVEETLEINAIPHRVFMAQNSGHLAIDLADWLMHKDGKYCEYRDSVRPGYFTKAICTSLGDMTTSGFDKTLETTLTFNRLPYWYSDIGQQPITIDSPENEKEYTIYNPEQYIATPTIIINGSGKVGLYINDIALNLYDTFENNYLKIDGETSNCYKIDGSAYRDFDATFFYYPVLLSGKNIIKYKKITTSADDAISKITIIPNWRRL